jgi:Uma2 family endonuclease
VRGPDILLAVEVADTSLDYDLGAKARLYAIHGVTELWVVNARRRTTAVHAGPTPDGWRRVEEKSPADMLVPAAEAFAHFRMRLGDID